MQKKQFLGLAMAVTIGMIPSYPVNAYTFRSKGMIDFQNGTESIVFDARDFSTVENNILQGKQNIINALEHIKTYFRADGTSQTGSRPDDPYTGNIGELSFTQIADAIKNSQKIPDLSDRTVTNKNGEPLYYKTEEAKEAENRMEITATDPGFEGAGIKGYVPATSDNLSVGTAAWVNGELILGNGADTEAMAGVSGVTLLAENQTGMITLDLSDRPNYQSITVENFLVEIASAKVSIHLPQDPNENSSKAADASIPVTYDNTTGIATIDAKDKRAESRGNGTSVAKVVYNVNVYLVGR